MAVLINFHLFSHSPLIACSFITISVKNQARLKRKIVGSYSRVFTVQDAQNSFHSSPISENFHSQDLIQETITNSQHRLIEKFL